MAFFKRPAAFDNGERRVLELLLSGESEFYARLRKQCEAPFLMGIERSTRPTRFTISLIYDGSVEQQYSLGESLSISIDDVMIVDRRVPQPIRAKAIIHHGVLGNVLLMVSDPVSWPKRIAVDEWFYLLPDGRKSKERLVDWGVLRQPSAMSSFALPPDYRAYLEAGQPLSLRSTSLLRHGEIYELDEKVDGHRMLVFGRARDGSVVTFSVDEERDSLMPVYMIERETGAAIRLANSFADWLVSGAALL